MAIEVKITKNKNRYSVRLYYMRNFISTGLSVSKKSDINLNKKEFNQSHKNQSNQIRLDNMISHYNQVIAENDKYLSSEEWKKIFKASKFEEREKLKEEAKKQQQLQNHLLNHSEEWLEEYKLGILGSKKVPSERTIKSYRSVIKSITDYIICRDKKKKKIANEEFHVVELEEKIPPKVAKALELGNFNFKEMKHLYEFLTTPYKAELSDRFGNSYYKPKGNFSPKNLMHFNVTLKMYLRWVSNKHGITIDKNVMEYKVPYTRNTESIIAMNEQQFRDIHKYQPKDDAEKFKKDIILFLLNTGLAVIDFSKLTPIDFTEHQAEDGSTITILKGRRTKTKSPFEVPLNTTALEIAKRHKFNFKKHNLTSKSLTPYCRTIWKKIPSFDVDVEGVDWDVTTGDYEKIPVNLISAFSLHNCRSTFASMLVRKNVPINNIIGLLGWRNMDMLMIYMKVFGEKKVEPTEVLTTILKE